MELTVYQVFSYAVVLSGHIPARCLANTMNRSCTRDHHNPHRPFKKISGHRVTSCLTQTEIKKDSIIAGTVDFNLQAPHRKELEEDLLQCQRKDTEVNERIVEMYSELVNTDITELVVIDESSQCETCKRQNARRVFFAHVEPCSKHCQQSCCNVKERKV